MRFADDADMESALMHADALGPEPSLMSATLFFQSASNSEKFGGKSSDALPVA
jgi:hypothetical protein